MGLVVVRILSIILSVGLSVYVANYYESIALQFELGTRYVNLLATVFGIFTIQTLSYQGITSLAKWALRITVISGLVLSVFLIEYKEIIILALLIYVCKYRALLSNKIFDRRMTTYDGMLFYMIVPVALLFIIVSSDIVFISMQLLIASIYLNIEYRQRNITVVERSYDWLTMNGLSGLVLNNVDLMISNMVDEQLAVKILYLKRISLLFESGIQTVMHGLSKEDFYSLFEKLKMSMLLAALSILFLLPAIFEILFKIDLKYFSVEMFYFITLLFKSISLVLERRIFENPMKIKLYALSNLLIGGIMYLLLFLLSPLWLLSFSIASHIFTRIICSRNYRL